MTFAYAAYGSNLHPVRLTDKKRCPSAALRGTCVMSGYRLLFRKRSIDGSAKCDAKRTGNPQDALRIAVFAIAESEEAALDSAEGLGHGYHKDTVELTVNGQKVSATIYIADDDAIVTDVPYEWYKQMVVLGTEYHDFPDAYVKPILEVAAKTDGKQERAAKNWAVVDAMRDGNQALQASDARAPQPERWERRFSVADMESDVDQDEVRAAVVDAQKVRRAFFRDASEPTKVLEDFSAAKYGRLTNGGDVLFAANPALRLPQIRIRAMRYNSDKAGSTYRDMKSFEGPLHAIFEDAYSFVVRNTPSVSRFIKGSPKREDSPLYPENAVREALINV